MIGYKNQGIKGHCDDWFTGLNFRIVPVVITYNLVASSYTYK